MGWERPGHDRATGGRTSPIYVPAEKVVLHQHVLDAFLQGFLLLLHTGTAPHCLGLHSMGCWGTQRGSPRWQEPEWSFTGNASTQAKPWGPASATQEVFGLICQHTHHSSPFGKKTGCWAKDQPQPPTSLFAGSSQSWERLKAKQQRTLGGRGGCRSPSGWLFPTSDPQGHWTGLQKPSTRARSLPELTLDLDPARAAQEGPRLVPLFHSRQAGAEHLQPQV